MTATTTTLADIALVDAFESSVRTHAYKDPRNAYVSTQVERIRKALYDALAAPVPSVPDISSLRSALERIASWDLPSTNEFWDDEKTQPVSFEYSYGSNGARDVIQQIAIDALAASPVGTAQQGVLSEFLAAAKAAGITALDLRHLYDEPKAEPFQSRAQPWILICQINAGVPEPETMAEYGYYEPSKWLPIESAPKHTEVLVWREDSGPFIAQFSTPEGVLPTDVLEQIGNDFPDDFEEWYSEAYGWQEGTEKPTHWQALPAGPVEQGEQG